jgi:thiol-disulfide isomerase/thioredoxin
MSLAEQIARRKQRSQQQPPPARPPAAAHDPFAVPEAYTVAEWLNTGAEPGLSRLLGAADGHTISSYFGSHPAVKVLLVDFFAYSCTNCLRTIPGLVALHRRYSAHGLAVLAYHRPEFDFERVVRERWSGHQLGPATTP